MFNAGGLAFRRPSTSECHQSKGVPRGRHRDSRRKILNGKVYGNNNGTFNNDKALNKEVKIKPRLHAYRLLLTTTCPFNSGFSDPVPSSNPSSNQAGSDWPIGVQSSAIARTGAANERPGLFGWVRRDALCRDTAGVVTCKGPVSTREGGMDGEVKVALANG